MSSCKVISDWNEQMEHNAWMSPIYIRLECRRIEQQMIVIWSILKLVFCCKISQYYQLVKITWYTVICWIKLVSSNDMAIFYEIENFEWNFSWSGEQSQLFVYCWQCHIGLADICLFHKNNIWFLLMLCKCYLRLLQFFYFVQK